MAKRTRRKPWNERAPEHKRREVEGIVCHLFCRNGLTAPEIQRIVLKEHGIDISREEVYRFVRNAAVRGWVTYTPPRESMLDQRLREECFSFLQDVSVVQTARCEDVALRGARMLLSLLQQHFAGEVVHVGFSGGYALRMLADRFAELLRTPAERLPKEIVFHAMVAGFDVSEPTTDPNAFFTYFVKDPAMQVDTSFVALHAPAMARSALLEQLKEQPGLREAYARAPEVDVIVTSASCWTDAHSALRRYLEVADEPIETLEREGCVGDVLWQPIGPQGPIEMTTDLRAMTLMQLSDLADFVADRHHVLLVAGPCGSCHQPKTAVVKTILQQDRPLITHLAIDSRCGRDLV